MLSNSLSCFLQDVMVSEIPLYILTLCASLGGDGTGIFLRHPEKELTIWELCPLLPSALGPRLGQIHPDVSQASLEALWAQGQRVHSQAGLF